MKKILLDFGIPDSKESTQEYIADKMGFGQGYGKNADALYDELTSISEPTAIGIYMPMGDMIDLDFDLMLYFDSISEVFTDAEEANPQLAVIFGDITANPGYDDEYADLMDQYIDDYTGERISRAGNAADDEYADDDTDGSDGDEDDEFADMPGDNDVLMIDLDRIKQ